jgi:hypothetical protein
LRAAILSHWVSGPRTKITLARSITWERSPNPDLTSLAPAMATLALAPLPGAAEMAGAGCVRRIHQAAAWLATNLAPSPFPRKR